MGVLAHHVVLVLSVAALAGAGVRVATAAGARGLPRVLAAAALGFAAAVAQALALGLVDLGTSPWALGAAAGLTWLAARRLPVGVPVRTELAWWWGTAPSLARAGVVASAVFAVGWTVWQLRYPYLGFDSLLYHLSLPALWIQDGSPGSLVDNIPGLPVDAYPVTSEVWMTWAIAISRSWVAASVVNVALLAMTAVAAVVGLRAAGAPRLIAGLGAGALTALPLLTSELGGPGTDLAAVSWLAVAGALAAVAVRRETPALIAVALVAAGLAFGAKTTTALPAAAALGAALWLSRGRLRAGPLVGGLLVALVVGGLWPLRNLILHGWPLWPFASGPAGDPLPALLAAVEGTFAEHPGEMLDGRVGDYVSTLSGGLALLAAGLLLPLARRSRLALGAWVVALVGVLSWTVAPFTGIDQDAYATGALRYLIPAIAAATAAVAVTAAGAGRTLQRVVAAALGGALLWSLARTLDQGFPVVPSLGTVLALVVAGAAAGAVAARFTPSPAAWVAPVVALLAGGALALSADGYVERHARTAQLDFGLLLRLAETPGDGTIAMAPGVIPLAAGDELERPLVRVAPGTPCGVVRGFDRFAYRKVPAAPGFERLVACREDAPTWENDTWVLFG